MRAGKGKSLSYGLYRFGIVEAEGMKAIKGLEYPRNPLFPEESLPLHFLYFTFFFYLKY